MKMNLSDGEKKLFKIFLEDYGEVLGNNGCNDLTDEMKACLTREEWDLMAKQYHEWNGDPEWYRPGENLQDHSVLYYLQRKLGL